MVYEAGLGLWPAADQEVRQARLPGDLYQACGQALAVYCKELPRGLVGGQHLLLAVDQQSHDRSALEKVSAPELDRHEVKFVSQGDVGQFFEWLEKRWPGWAMPRLFFSVKAATACRLLFLSQASDRLQMIDGAGNGSRTCRSVPLGSGKPANNRQRIVGVRESVGWTLCLTLSDRSASWARRRPRGYVYCAGQVRVAAACTRNRQDTAPSRLQRVHRACREAISRQRNRHVRTHEMPKRSDPFTGLAGPGLTEILAIATTVAAR